MFDVTYNEPDIGFDDPFRAVVAFAHTGWNGKFGTLPSGPWAGVIDRGTPAWELFCEFRF
jgi:hypothetical protein